MKLSTVLALAIAALSSTTDARRSRSKEAFSTIAARSAEASASASASTFSTVVKGSNAPHTTPPPLFMDPSQNGLAQSLDDQCVITAKWDKIDSHNTLRPYPGHGMDNWHAISPPKSGCSSYRREVNTDGNWDRTSTVLEAWETETASPVVVTATSRATFA